MFIESIKQVGEKRGLQSILLLFRNEFNKFYNTGAKMLDSIYHRTLKLHKNCIFDVKTSRFCVNAMNQISMIIILAYFI